MGAGLSAVPGALKAAWAQDRQTSVQSSQKGAQQTGTLPGVSTNTSISELISIYQKLDAIGFDWRGQNPQRDIALLDSTQNQLDTVAARLTHPLLSDYVWPDNDGTATADPCEALALLTSNRDRLYTALSDYLAAATAYDLVVGQLADGSAFEGALNDSLSALPVELSGKSLFFGSWRYQPRDEAIKLLNVLAYAKEEGSSLSVEALAAAAVDSSTTLDDSKFRWYAEVLVDKGTRPLALAYFALVMPQVLTRAGEFTDTLLAGAGAAWEYTTACAAYDDRCAAATGELTTAGDRLDGARGALERAFSAEPGPQDDTATYANNYGALVAWIEAALLELKTVPVSITGTRTAPPLAPETLAHNTTVTLSAQNATRRLVVDLAVAADFPSDDGAADFSRYHWVVHTTDTNGFCDVSIQDTVLSIDVAAQTSSFTVSVSAVFEQTGSYTANVSPLVFTVQVKDTLAFSSSVFVTTTPCDSTNQTSVLNLPKPLNATGTIIYRLRDDTPITEPWGRITLSEKGTLVVAREANAGVYDFAVVATDAEGFSDELSVSLAVVNDYDDAYEQQRQQLMAIQSQAEELLSLARSLPPEMIDETYSTHLEAFLDSVGPADLMWNNGRPTLDSKSTEALAGRLRTIGRIDNTLFGVTELGALAIEAVQPFLALMPMNKQVAVSGYPLFRLPSVPQAYTQAMCAAWDVFAGEIVPFSELVAAYGDLQTYVTGTDYSKLTNLTAVHAYVQGLSARYTAFDGALSRFVYSDSILARTVFASFERSDQFVGNLAAAAWAKLLSVEVKQTIVDRLIGYMHSEAHARSMAAVLSTVLAELDSHIQQALGSLPTVSLKDVVAVSGQIARSLAQVANLTQSIVDTIAYFKSGAFGSSGDGQSGEADSQSYRDKLTKLRDFINGFVRDESVAAALLSRLDQLCVSLELTLSDNLALITNWLDAEISTLWVSAIEVAECSAQSVAAALRSIPNPTIVRCDSGNLSSADPTATFKEGVYFDTLDAVIAQINRLLAFYKIDHRLSHSVLPISAVGSLPAGFSFADNTLWVDRDLFIRDIAQNDNFDKTTRGYVISLKLNTGISSVDAWLSEWGIDALAVADFEINLDLIDTDNVDEGTSAGSVEPGPGLNEGSVGDTGGNDTSNTLGFLGSVVLDEVMELALPVDAFIDLPDSQPGTTELTISDARIPLSSMFIGDEGELLLANVALMTVSSVVCVVSLTMLRGGGQPRRSARSTVSPQNSSLLSQTLVMVSSSLGVVSLSLFVLSQSGLDELIAEHPVWTPVLVTITTIQIVCVATLLITKILQRLRRKPIRPRLKIRM
jgi:hypothetical protein